MLSILLICSSLIGDVTNVEVSPKFIEESNIKIIDIRTKKEWKDLGVISGAHLITFFREDKKFNSESFLKDLNMLVEKDEQFAIISNKASRTKLVSNFLGHKHQYNVVNLIGGMSKLIKDGYKVAAYEPNKKKVKETAIEQKQKPQEEKVLISNEKKEEKVKSSENNTTKA